MNGHATIEKMLRGMRKVGLCQVKMQAVSLMRAEGQSMEMSQRNWRHPETGKYKIISIGSIST